MKEKLTTKKYGTSADIYVEHIDETGVKNFMLINDGNIELENALYHVFASEDLECKIFKGRIGNAKEFKIMMKALGHIN